MKDEEILRSDKKVDDVEEKTNNDLTEVKYQGRSMPVTTMKSMPLLKQLTLPAPSVTLKKGRKQRKELSIGFDKELQLTLG